MKIHKYKKNDNIGTMNHLNGRKRSLQRIDPISIRIPTVHVDIDVQRVITVP